MPYADYHADPKPTIVLSTQWIERELVKQIPGASWNDRMRTWSLPATWPVCLQLRGIFGDELRLSDRLIAWAVELRKTRIEPSLELRTRFEAPEDIDTGRLFGFQWIDTQFLNLTGSALLGNDMGTGKTVSIASILTADKLPALIVCPNSVKSSWAQHLDEWAPTRVEPVVVGGSITHRRWLLEQAAKNPRAAVIINYESMRLHSSLAPYGSVHLRKCRECDKNFGIPELRVTQCEVHKKELDAIQFRTVIVDEAHRIKDPTSKQTRAIWRQARDATYRYLATGTLIARDPSDLWPLLHTIAPDEFPTRGAFIDRYCLHAYNHSGGIDIVGINPQTRAEFYALLDPRYRRVPKSLVLDQLPPKVYSTRTVSMSPKQAKAYRDISRKLITELADGTVLVAPNDLVAQNRLVQLASAYCTVVDTGEVDADGRPKLQVELVDVPPSPKIDALLEIMEDGGPDGVYAVSSPSRRLIELTAARLTKLKIPFSKIVGGMSDSDRDYELNTFQSGRTKVMLFTLQAGGIGLTMTAANTMIRLSRSWSLIDNKQGEDRVHRIGSERHEVINIIDIVTADTVEDKVQLPRMQERMLRLEEIQRDRALRLERGLTTFELDDEEQRLLSSNLGQ